MGAPGAGKGTYADGIKKHFTAQLKKLWWRN